MAMHSTGDLHIEQLILGTFTWEQSPVDISNETYFQINVNRNVLLELSLLNVPRRSVGRTPTLPAEQSLAMWLPVISSADFQHATF